MKKLLHLILFFSVACGLVAEAKDAPQENLRLKTVVLDAGHGGRDPGCVSADGKTYEKNLVLKITLKLKELIEQACPDVTVLTTRSNDTFVPLIDRTGFATKNNADLFLSIHINAQYKGSNANGFSMHLLGQSQDRSKDTYAFNMDVCQRENSVIYLEEDYNTTYKGLTEDDPQNAIFLNLMHAAYREQSLLFAETAGKKLAEAGVIRRNNGIMQNNFAVLRLATMPAVLLELGFITNQTDLAALRKDDNLDKIAKALLEAFLSYKEQYDASMRIDTAEPVQNPGTSPAAGKRAESDQSGDRTEPNATQNLQGGAETPGVPAATGTSGSPLLYGTQIFASGKRLPLGDERFLGYIPSVVPGTRIFKYIIGTSDTLEAARAEYKKIKERYPDAFLVRIENGQLERVR